MKIFISLILVFGSWAAYCDILGDFSNPLQLPGYISLSKKSLVQDDPFDQKKNKDDLENRSPSEIIYDYFKSGTFDKEKFEEFLQKIRLKEKNEFIAFCISSWGAESCEGQIVDGEIQAKWRKHPTYLAFDELRKLISETIDLSDNLDSRNLNDPSSALFLHKFFSTLELWEALKKPNRELGQPSLVGRIVRLNLFNYLLTGKKFSIESGRPEAANILVPIEYQAQFPNQLFFSPEQLELLEKKGVDISRFNPPDSDFWSFPSFPIGKYNLTNYNGDSRKTLRHLFDEEFVNDLVDSEKTVDLEYVYGVPFDGTNPRFLGKIKGQNFEVKYVTDRLAPYPKSTDLLNLIYSLTNQTDTYTEKVVNNMAAAMGFTVEPTYFKKKVRLFISKRDENFNEKFQQLLKEVISINRKFNNPESAFQIIKTDEETGLNYIELHNVSLEKKDDERSDLNLSFFIRHGLGKHLKREHRGLAFIQALLEDMNPKDLNDKIKLKPITDKLGERRYRIVAVVDEMGGSLGFGMPNFFSKEFVTNVKKGRNGVKKINFRYPRFYPLPLLKSITIADAKWVMRLFGQLTYDQILKSFQTSGYPPFIADLMTRKLMGRRNQVMGALGLIGEQITDAQKNELVLKKEKEFSDSIEGYEKFFRKGLLNDPEDKLFPKEESPFKRSWTGSFNPKVGSKRIKNSFKSIGELILGGANMGASSLLARFKYDFFPVLREFEPVQDFESTFDEICLGGNCFAQALSVGPLGLIPFSFVIDNPDKTSKKPFLIVNMFRIGVKLSSKVASNVSTGFFSFTTSIPNPEVVGDISAIKEYITVTGTDNILTYSQDIKKAIKVPSLISRKKLKSFVEKLEKGQTLIMSSYFSGEIHGYGNFAPAGFGAAIGGGFVLGLTNRIILNKESDNQLLSHWSKLTKKEIEVLLQAKAFLGINIAGLSVGQTKVRDRTFTFDPSKPEEMKYIMENLQTITPSKIPEKFRLQERLLSESSAVAKAGLLFFLNAKMSSVSGEMILKDFVSGEEKKEDYRIIRIKKERPIGKNTLDYETIYKIGIDKDLDIFVNISNNFNSKNLTREKLKDVLKNLEGSIPENFIPYDIDALSYYLGEFDIRITNIIGRIGLSQFFDKNEGEICTSYAQINNFPIEECLKSKMQLPLKVFLKDFKQAKIAFNRFKNNEPLKSHEKLGALNQILDIFSRYTQDRFIIYLLKKTVSFENYFTDATIESDILIGTNRAIFTDIKGKGALIPSFRQKVIDPSKQFELFSDELTQALGNVFFQFN